jgi:soluble lytic murein transglycosylase-like protein
MKTQILFLILVTGLMSFNSFASRDLASVRQTLRVTHAKELMGTSYKKSVVAKFEQKKDIEKNIYEVVKNRLPKKFQYKAYSVARTIIEESSKNSLDPYFVMAGVSGESSFNPLAVGPVGEIGMMQIRPSTGEWMSNILKTKWRGAKSLQDPVTNIKLGTAYLAWLRSKFDGHGQLYLAAYNMGPKSVKNAVSRNVYPKDYPIHVMKRYIAFYKDIGAKKKKI